MPTHIFRLAAGRFLISEKNAGCGTVQFLRAKARLLHTCWNKVLAGNLGFALSPGDQPN